MTNLSVAMTTEFVRNSDVDWATLEELLVLSYGNL